MNFTIKDLEIIASSISSSGLFPEVRNKEMALTMMLMCQAEGLHPVQAFRRYHIVSNRISMKADAILSDFKKNGGELTWVKYEDDECIGSFLCDGMKSPLIVSWNTERAKKAGLGGNQWNKYPRQMLKARVISEGVRACMPFIVEGIYSEEEENDIAEEKEKKGKEIKKTNSNGTTDAGSFQSKGHIGNFIEKIVSNARENYRPDNVDSENNKWGETKEEKEKIRNYENEIDRKSSIEELAQIGSLIQKENFNETVINYLKLKYKSKKDWLLKNSNSGEIKC